MAIKNNATLSVMLGSREEFQAQGKTYSVAPMPAAHVNEFMKDNLSLGTQLFALSDDDGKAKLNKWLGEVSVEILGQAITNVYCKNNKDEIMTVDKCMLDGWSIKDFTRYIKSLCDFSG